MSTVSILNSATFLEGSPTICPGLVLTVRSTKIRVNAVLGEGCFGKVYSVKLDDDSRRYAMKTIPVQDDETYKSRFHEVKILRSLIDHRSHDHHIVKIKLGFVETIAGTRYICILMERMGMHLQDFLRCRRHQPFDLRDIRIVAKQMLKALKHIHKLGLVHADLKMSNILCSLLTSDLHVKLADFGSSGTLKALRNCEGSIQPLGFRAPEVLLGLPFDETIDIFSLGAVLTELYTGKPLFPAESALQLAQFQYELIGKPYNATDGILFDALYEYNRSKGIFEPRLAEDQVDGRQMKCKLGDVVKFGKSTNGLRQTNFFTLLLEALLAVNMYQRPAAKEALQMKFFK